MQRLARTRDSLEMRICGRLLSKWWLLLLPPILIMTLPLLLMIFFMGNNLAGAIFGPPAIWNRPRHTPERADLVGNYLESERHLDTAIGHPPATLTLDADGSMSVTNLPFEFGETSCILSGRGTWSGPDEAQQIQLTVSSNGSTGSCKSGFYPAFELAGHSKPYALYWVVGDPDSGTGVWLRSR